MKTIQTFVLATITLIASIACNSTGAQNKPQEKTAMSSKAVVELTSESFNAKVYDTKLRDMIFLGNRPAVVDFTATWCGPCRQEIPYMKALEKEFEGAEIVFLGLSIDKDKQAWKKMVRSGELSGVVLR